MATLNSYLKDTYRLLHDPKQETFNPENLIAHINTARRELVTRTQCVRILTNSSGACETGSVTAGGSGYTSAPTATITPPDFPSGTGAFPGGSQATATTTIQSGTLSAINITYGGSGYFQPLVSFSGGGGSGAAGTIVTSPINVLTQGREVYNFSDVDLTSNPGAGAVYCVISISIIYSNYRYSLPVYAFSQYQSAIRQYSQQYQYVPAFASQYGQGTSGSFYVYPLPSQTYAFELDCLCLPQDLITDLSVEIIPDPWCDAIKHYVAFMAYNDIQNFNAARYHLDLFDRFTLARSIAARPGRMINPYGRP